MPTRPNLFRFLGVLLSSVSLSATVIYVTPGDGRTGGTGTKEAPFTSLAQALKRLKPGDTCRLLPGTYREIIADVPRGTREQPIVIRADQPGKAVVTGLDPVRNWQRVKGDVWKAKVPRTLPGRNFVMIDGRAGHRARWPNRSSDDFLAWEGIPFRPQTSARETLHCPQLPDRPKDYWKGSILWVMGGAKWTSWSVKVTGSDPQRKTLSFILTQRARGAGGSDMSLVDRRGGYFYLLGDQREIDRPGEFYVDEATKTLYLQMPPGQDPHASDIQMQTRKLAVNLQNAAYLRLEGFQVRGAGITLSGTRHCTLAGLTCTWLGSTDGGDSGYGIAGDGIGVYVSGQHNVVRDSEISHSYGHGVSLNGTDNSLINCHIHHVDYTGCYSCPVSLSGSRALVSHNTIHDTGRDCIIPHGKAHIIQYNNIYNMGRICHDLGATYICGTNGEGTEIHHNWVHDNLAKGTRMGIYLDNFTCNYFVYKNVVWNIRGCGIRLNKPAHNNYVINNTIMEKAGNWGRWPTDWMYNCIYANNVLRKGIHPHPQIVVVANQLNVPQERLNETNFMTYADGAGKGIHIPGITAENPAIGAYEPGETWRAGHDFNRPPKPVYQPLDTPLRNLILSATLRFYGGKNLAPWERTGPGTAQLKWWPGGIGQSYDTRYAIINSSLGLMADGDGIQQKLAPLKPGQEYEFCCWYRLEPDQPKTEIMLLVKDQKGKVNKAMATADTTWRMITMPYVAPNRETRVTVGVTKIGQGKLWVDSFAFVGILQGLRPKLPGLAKLPSGRKRWQPPAQPRKPLPIPTVGQLTQVISSRPGGGVIEEKPGTLTLSRSGNVIQATITVPLNSPLELMADPQWGDGDGMEFCFAYSDNNAMQTTFVLHGYPNGKLEPSLEAGATDQDCKRLLKATTFKAEILPGKGWRGSWTLALDKMDLPCAEGTIYDVNAGIYRREDNRWLQWYSTSGQTWRVKEAGRVILK